MTRVSKTSIGALVLLLSLAVLSGCVKRNQYTVQSGDSAPGADAHIDITRQDEGNFLVEIEATNLIPPARLSEGLSVYAVWFQAEGQAPIRAGDLAYDAEERTGTLSATTANGDIEVIISGEAEGQVVNPSDNVVFRANMEAP